MMNEAQVAIVLIALCATAGAIKENTLKDAALTQTELRKTIERVTSKGFIELTDQLSTIDSSISAVVAQLNAETDPRNITQLETQFLRLKTRLFYEQIAVESDVTQAESLAQRAEVLLAQLKLDIKSLEAHNLSGQVEILRIDMQQVELFSAILKKEKSREPLRYIETLLGNVERNVERKLNSIEQELDRLKKEQKPHESYYSTISFTQALDIVLKNLRAEGKRKLADEIQELSIYVIGLEKLKESGKYKGTEMERTLNNNIRANKNKLLAIINQLLRYY